MINIGRQVDGDEAVYLDSKKSHAILICGKRGSGKSYTMGVMIEEYMSLGDSLVIVVDPMGIYYTFSQPNYDQERLLWDWGLNIISYPVRMLVPGNTDELYGNKEIVQAMEQMGLQFHQFRINPSDLSPEGWCDLFDLSISDVMGIALFRSIQKLKRTKKNNFFIPDIIKSVDSDPLISDKTRQALLNRLEMAIDWGIFGAEYQEIWEIFDKNCINILDLSVLDPGNKGRRNLVLDILARDIFKRRTLSRRKEELNLANELPKVIMLVDEAHQFIPSGRKTLSKDILIRWAKEGRQPGLSLIVASQQPSALDSEVITQCDIVVAQKLTNGDDIAALNALNQDYMGSELKTYIRRLDRKGEAVIVDDEQEKVKVVQIRPRKSHHGGREV